MNILIVIILYIYIYIYIYIYTDFSPARPPQRKPRSGGARAAGRRPLCYSMLRPIFNYL